MQDTTKTYLSPEMYESIISFQEMRIEALEKRIHLLEYLNKEAQQDASAILQAQNATMDWISNKLFE
jgi:hypothetical protein